MALGVTEASQVNVVIDALLARRGVIPPDVGDALVGLARGAYRVLGAGWSPERLRAALDAHAEGVVRPPRAARSRTTGAQAKAAQGRAGLVKDGRAAR
jgi:hypothetical protein